jgi:hypothetical protein
MSATTTRTSNTTDEAGVPPAPSEAHQRAYVAGDTRVVMINGSRIRMKVRRTQVVERQCFDGLDFDLILRNPNYDREAFRLRSNCDVEAIPLLTSFPVSHRSCFYTGQRPVRHFTPRVLLGCWHTLGA